MTIDELKAFLLEHDPKLKKYFYAGSDPSYTIWEPHHRRPVMSDDPWDDLVIKVPINRYAKDDGDTVADEIFNALEALRVPLDEMITTFDPEDGYFRHIIECYVALAKEVIQHG